MFLKKNHFSFIFRLQNQKIFIISRDTVKYVGIGLSKFHFLFLYIEFRFPVQRVSNTRDVHNGDIFAFISVMDKRKQNVKKPKYRKNLIISKYIFFYI